VTNSRNGNTDAALDLWDAIATGDAHALRSIVTDKCVWRMRGNSPLAGTYVGPDEILGFLARVGELTDILESELVDVYTSESGAILHYSIHAVRGLHKLDTEHLFLTTVESGRISGAVFAPFDQAKYDRFFTPQ